MEVKNYSEKSLCLGNLRILLEAMENVPSSYKSNVFPKENSTSDPTIFYTVVFYTAYMKLEK